MLVLLGGNSDKPDFAKNQVGGRLQKSLEKEVQKLQKKVAARSQTSEKKFILSVVYLFYISKNSLMMKVYSSKPFVCWWSITNRVVNDFNRTGHRNRKNCVCGNGGCFCGCFVHQIVIQNGGTTMDPLDEDIRRYGIDGTVN